MRIVNFFIVWNYKKIFLQWCFFFFLWATFQPKRVDYEFWSVYVNNRKLVLDGSLNLPFFFIPVVSLSFKKKTFCAQVRKRTIQDADKFPVVAVKCPSDICSHTLSTHYLYIDFYIYLHKYFFFKGIVRKWVSIYFIISLVYFLKKSLLPKKK